MVTLGELLSSQRSKKRKSLSRAAADLAIKKEYLEALEKGDWAKLPEPPFIKGFVKNYAQYLGLDTGHILAIFRREFDETKYPQKSPINKSKRLMITPNRVLNFTVIMAILFFIAYLAIQYFSILSAPKLKIASPPDDFTTPTPVVIVMGETDKDASVSVDGQFVPVDPEGNFSYQVTLEEGQNIIEIIVSKRLSPKSKVIRTIRLSR